jgi:hypothetical protein
MLVGTARNLFVNLAIAVGVAVPILLAQEKNSERNVYFGETHQHTSWSFDAYVFGKRITGPAVSYKYFKGEPIKHPLGYDIKIETPLDLAGLPSPDVAPLTVQERAWGSPICCTPTSDARKNAPVYRTVTELTKIVLSTTSVGEHV